MMNRIVHIRLLILLVSALLSGQTLLRAQATVELNSVAMLLQQGNPDSALKTINIYLNDPKNANDPQTLYYKGKIYSELQKKYSPSDPSTFYLDSCIFYYSKSLKLSIDTGFQSSVRKSVRFVAAKYFNTAVSNMNPVHHAMAESMYRKYKEVYRVADPKMDFRQRDIEFYLALGTVYTELYYQNPTKNAVYFNKAIDVYKIVLSIDPRNYQANYGIASLYWNYGANIFNRDSIDIIDIGPLQDSALKAFRTALPYAELCHELEPEKEEPLIMLIGIYYSMNEFEKSAYFQKKLDDLRAKKSGR